jgi:hypothetical protein
MGGLAFASIMAKLRKWRLLLLERHFKIGGFTHTFTRRGGLFPRSFAGNRQFELPSVFLAARPCKALQLPQKM